MIVWREIIVCVGLGGLTLMVSRYSEFYSSCYYPMDKWLITHMSSSLSFRLTHMLCCSDSVSRKWAYALAVLLFAVLYPFLWIWSALGLHWLWRSGGSCLPSITSQSWFIGWVVYSLAHLTLFAVLFSMAHRDYLSRSGSGYPAGIVAIHSIVTIIGQHFHHEMPFITNRLGLSDQEIDRVPIYKFQLHSGPVPCAICLADIHVGDDIRLLGSCKHQFHRLCMDEWLKIRRTCPNCVQDVQDSTTRGYAITS